TPCAANRRSAASRISSRVERASVGSRAERASAGCSSARGSAALRFLLAFAGTAAAHIRTNVRSSTTSLQRRLPVARHARGARVSNARARELALLREHHALVLEQPALAEEPAAVPRERAVGADHPVAGDDDADRVRAVREPDGAGRRRLPEARGKGAVGRRRAGRDLAQRLPEAPLELRAAGLHRDLVERAQVTREVATYARYVRGRAVALADLVRFLRSMQKPRHAR